MFQQAFLNMFDTNDNRNFDETKLRLSESGYDPRYRLAKALGIFSKSPSWNINFLVGKIIEEKYLIELKKLYPDLQREVEIVTPFETMDAGHADAVIDSMKKITEIKSMSTARMEKAPFFYHIYQLQGYQKYYKYKEGDLVCIDYNGVYTPKAFPVISNSHIQDEIHEVHCRLNSAVKEGKMYWEPSYWSDSNIPLKKYFIPQDFSEFLAEHFKFEELEDMEIELNLPVNQTANDVAAAWLQAKINKNNKEEKFYTQQLETFFEEGMTEIPLPDNQLLIATKSQDSIHCDYEKALQCGVKTFQEIQKFVSVKAGTWTKRIKKINGGM